MEILTFFYIILVFILTIYTTVDAEPLCISLSLSLFQVSLLGSTVNGCR